MTDISTPGPSQSERMRTRKRLAGTLDQPNQATTLHQKAQPRPGAPAAAVAPALAPDVAAAAAANRAVRGKVKGTVQKAALAPAPIDPAPAPPAAPIDPLLDMTGEST